MPEEYLLVTDGPSQGARLDIGGDTVTIGRDDDCELTLDDSQSSRRHARVAPGPEGITIEDLGSTNGTLVNGTRITGSQPLRPGDEVRIGRSTLMLRSTAAHTEIGTPEALEGAAPAPVAPPPVAAPPPPPPAAAPPPPPPPAPAPPPPPAPPVAAPAGPAPLAAPAAEHGYPQPAPAPARIPGERDPAEGIRALQGDRQVRFRAYLVTFIVLALVLLAVLLYLIAR